jgi:hypothetical protein
MFRNASPSHRPWAPAGSTRFFQEVYVKAVRHTRPASRPRLRRAQVPCGAERPPNTPHPLRHRPTSPGARARANYSPDGEPATLLRTERLRGPAGARQAGCGDACAPD